MVVLCFRIWDENNVDNTLMCSAVARQSRTFQLLVLAGTADPKWPKGYPIPYDVTLSIQSWQKKKEGANVQSDGVCLPKQPLHVMEPSFPRDGWTPACQWEAVNEFFLLLCLCSWLLLYLLNYLHLNPRVFSLLPFWVSPQSHWGGVSEQLYGGELLAGVKPQRKQNHIF